MKKVVFLFMTCCAMAMSLMSCHREPELTPEEEKTIAVRKVYYQRVLGQWYYEEQSALDIVTLPTILWKKAS